MQVGAVHPVADCLLLHHSSAYDGAIVQDASAITDHTCAGVRTQQSGVEASTILSLHVPVVRYNLGSHLQVAPR